MSVEQSSAPEDRAPEATTRATPLGDRIRSIRFTPTRLREGYDMGQVDDALDELAELADSGEDLVPLALGIDFTTTRLREGYDAEEVDAFLTAVAKGTAV